MRQCGYIALIGAPNAGKSTLLNALLHKKISIVSQKPHTTRTRILGIVTSDHVQMLFLDTPGFVSRQLSTRGIKDSATLKSVPWDACGEADVICYLVDATRGWHAEDSICLQKLVEAYQKKIFVIGTKTDKLKKADVLRVTQEFEKHINELNTEAKPQLLMLSAKKPENVAFLLSILSQNMPNSEWLYEKDSVTDSPEKFICAEFVREQLFRQLGDELPYQTTVIIDKLENSAQIVRICATITVIRESQKAIIIGRGGSRLKQIGQLSRESLEKYFGKKIFLEIFVKKGDI